MYLDILLMSLNFNYFFVNNTKMRIEKNNKNTTAIIITTQVSLISN